MNGIVLQSELTHIVKFIWCRTDLLFLFFLQWMKTNVHKHKKCRLDGIPWELHRLASILPNYIVLVLWRPSSVFAALLSPMLKITRNLAEPPIHHCPNEMTDSQLAEETQTQQTARLEESPAATSLWLALEQFIAKTNWHILNSINIWKDTGMIIDHGVESCGDLN